MPPRIDLTGKKFGRLTVVCVDKVLPCRNYAWTCVCSCGKIKVISGHGLKAGTTKSCGCLQVERSRMRRGKKHPSWRGGKTKNRDGYILVNVEGKYIKQSLLVVEKAIGKGRPAGSIIHHVDGDKGNDSNNNLVLCEDNNYHSLIHRRERMLKECGHANYRRCWICKKYDDPKNLYKPPGVWKGSIRHRKCMYEYNKCHKKAHGIK